MKGYIYRIPLMQPSWSDKIIEMKTGLVVAKDEGGEGGELLPNMRI